MLFILALAVKTTDTAFVVEGIQVDVFRLCAGGSCPFQSLVQEGSGVSDISYIPIIFYILFNSYKLLEGGYKVLKREEVVAILKESL